MEKPISADDVVLPMLDRDPKTIIPEIVAHDLRLKAVAAPDAVLIPPGAIVGNRIAAEGGFDAVGSGIADVVGVDQVVVRAAAA